MLAIALLLEGWSRAVVSAFVPIDRLGFGRHASHSGRLQDAERYRGSAHVVSSPRCRGNMLAHSGSAAEEVSELVFREQP
jgi:hypothetical protein